MAELTFGRWLKRLRTEQDLTQERLAELANCATPTLRSFEIGKRRPSREMAERLAIVLKVPADQQVEFLRLARLPVARPIEAAANAVTVSTAPKSTLISSFPKPATPFIGRAADRAVLTQLIRAERRRLVTLLGPGGMGKTRLALEVAGELAAFFPDGVGFVALASVEHGQHLPAAIAHSLNIPLLGIRDPAEQVLSALVTRDMLLVLDNFEHLLVYPEALRWVSGLLARAPRVRCLITSRERLRIAGEHIFELGGLALTNPTAETETPVQETSDAVLLFLERAQAAVRDFALTQENKTAITHICHLVGGLPLGIELAATWVRVLNPAEIANEIERNVNFLARADRDSHPRHHSLRAVFDHSWSLLSGDEQEALGQLSVFRGGCRREAAATVAGAILPILATLIDKSLLGKSEIQGSTRYDLHEMIRQFALERLQNNPMAYEQCLQRHGEYYCAWVAEQSGAIGAQRQPTIVNELQAEIDNIRLAWEWAVQTRRGDLLYPMGRVMWIFCEIQNYYVEGEALFARAAQMADMLRMAPSYAQDDGVGRISNELLFGRMTTHQAYFVARQVRPRQALTLLTSALVLLRQLDDKHTLSQALWTCGSANWMHGNLAEAEANFRAGLVIAEQLQFPNLLALYHTFLGAVLHDTGEYELSFQHLQQALGSVRQLAEPRSVALSISYLHQTALALGHGPEMAALLREGLQIARAANDWYCIALALEQQALASLAQNKEAEANSLLAESLAIFLKIGDVWSQSRLHTHLGHLSLQQNNLGAAEEHFYQALRAGYRDELMTCVLPALAGLALLASQAGHSTQALTFALYVQPHPACYHRTRERMETLRSELEEQLSPTECATVRARVQATSLERWMSELAQKTSPSLDSDTPGI